MIEPKPVRIVPGHVRSPRGQHVRQPGDASQPKPYWPRGKHEVGVTNVIRPTPGKAARHEQSTHDVAEHLPCMADLPSAAEARRAVDVDAIDNLTCWGLVKSHGDHVDLVS